jgi:hypothetical protein
MKFGADSVSFSKSKKFIEFKLIKKWKITFFPLF